MRIPRVDRTAGRAGASNARKVPLPASDIPGGSIAPTDVPAPSVATVKRAAATSDLVESEKLLAETNRSGVRLIEAAEPEAAGTPAFDISNAVTKVQRAIELDAFLPPTVEVSVVVSETIALVRAPETLPITLAPVFASEEGPAQHPFAAPVAFDLADPAPVARRPPRRRRLAFVVFLGVMAGAVVLLASAFHSGKIRVPDAVKTQIHRLVP